MRHIYGKTRQFEINWLSMGTVVAPKCLIKPFSCSVLGTTGGREANVSCEGTRHLANGIYILLVLLGISSQIIYPKKAGWYMKEALSESAYTVKVFQRK